MSVGYAGATDYQGGGPYQGVGPSPSGAGTETVSGGGSIALTGDATVVVEGGVGPATITLPAAAAAAAVVVVNANSGADQSLVADVVPLGADTLDDSTTRIRLAPGQAWRGLGDGVTDTDTTAGYPWRLVDLTEAGNPWTRVDPAPGDLAGVTVARVGDAMRFTFPAGTATTTLVDGMLETTHWHRTIGPEWVDASATTRTNPAALHTRAWRSAVPATNAAFAGFAIGYASIADAVAAGMSAFDQSTITNQLWRPITEGGNQASAGSGGGGEYGSGRVDMRAPPIYPGGDRIFEHSTMIALAPGGTYESRGNATPDRNVTSGNLPPSICVALPCDVADAVEGDLDVELWYRIAPDEAPV